VKVEQGGRHRMLETIREYALEVGARHLPQCQEAHARWFLAVAEAGVDGMRGESRAVWTARLERERGNMRAALQHLDAGNAETAEPMLRLATSLGVFWYRTSPAIEDVDWIDRALARAPAAGPLLRGRALHALAICRGEQGWAEEALAHCRESYQLLRDTEDEGGKARALNSLGGLIRDLGRAEEAVPIMDESIALRRRLCDPSLPVTIALTNRSMAALDLGDLTTARRCLLECLELPDVDEVDLAQVRVGLADVAIEAGELTEATELLRLATSVLRRSDQRYRLVESLETFAALAVRRDMLREAAVLVAAADQILAEDGSVQVPADVRLRERRVGTALAGLPPDVRDEAAAAGRALSLDEALDLAVDLFL
jgi:tetratricopeptide (TPR) repeat protein